MTFKEQFQLWLKYERDTQIKIIESLNTVPQTHTNNEKFGKACSLLMHIVNCRFLWLNRIGFIEEKPSDIFPKLSSITGLKEGALQSYKIWTKFFDETHESEMDFPITYRNLSGHPYTKTLYEILSHLHGHSVYHLGQINSLIRELGGKPCCADFIYWTNEQLVEEE
ncbi:MAG: DinB family protein [Cytophagales bacterium]|nr:DinB family protein [Cytophagales bacterium]